MVSETTKRLWYLMIREGHADHDTREAWFALPQNERDATSESLERPVMTITEIKMQRLRAGERVVCSETDLDALFEALTDEEGNRLASIHNPAQVGTLDSYVAFLKPADSKAPTD